MASSQPTGRISISQLEELATEGTVEAVYCVTTDWYGQLFGKRVTVTQFLARCRQGKGVPFSEGFFAVSLDDSAPELLQDYGGYSSGFNNCLLVPDLATIRVATWLSRSAIVICDPYHLADRRPLTIAPRLVLKDAIAALRNRGVVLACGSELEFTIFNDTLSSAATKAYSDLLPVGHMHSPYTSLQYAHDDALLGHVTRELLASGISVESYGSEAGLGQKEINLEPADPLEAADQHALYKLGLKALVAQLGKSVTFMAKYHRDEPGNSFHVHISLWSAQDGSRYELRRDGSIESRVFQQCVGGLVATLPAMFLAYAPTVNSYRRFCENSCAPTTVSCGWDNRTCAFRLLDYGDDGTRIESRVAGADANPYLVLAATIVGMIYGIDKDLTMPPLVNGSAYEPSSRVSLPTSLTSALDRWDERGASLSPITEVIAEYMRAFAEQEDDAFRRGAVTDWERIRYFERV